MYDYDGIEDKSCGKCTYYTLAVLFGRVFLGLDSTCKCFCRTTFSMCFPFERHPELPAQLESASSTRAEAADVTKDVNGRNDLLPLWDIEFRNTELSVKAHSRRSEYRDSTSMRSLFIIIFAMQFPTRSIPRDECFAFQINAPRSYAIYHTFIKT